MMDEVQSIEAMSFYHVYTKCHLIWHDKHQLKYLVAILIQEFIQCVIDVKNIQAQLCVNSKLSVLMWTGPNSTFKLFLSHFKWTVCEHLLDNNLPWLGEK